jgi:hypothetical protein
VCRVRVLLAALVLTAAALLGAGNAPAVSGPAPLTTAAPVLISGVDLHDATIREIDGTYYMYGSMYGCGYQWYVPGTPWCGLGVSTATELQGPWTAPTLLFSPNSQDPWSKRSWQETCGGSGQGCFNPRMIQRTGWGGNDGVFILWFNAPRQYSDGAAHAYNAMGCNGPAGPCGPTAGAPHGSYNKPVLDVCSGNGDFGFIEPPAGRPALVCTMPAAAQLNIQELNWSGTGGNTGVGVVKVAAMDGPVEGPGGWWDAATSTYVLTFSDQGCGYCSGTPTGYALSPTLYSGWSTQGNVGWGAPDWGRRIFSPNSCGGQPRTVAVLEGRPWQIVDIWLGTRNEMNAGTLLSPLSYAPTTGAPGDGGVWVPPVSYSCR